MKLCFKHKADAAAFVNDLLLDFGLNFQSITITRQEKFADYCVLLATDLSSADIEQETVAKFFSETQVNT